MINLPEDFLCTKKGSKGGGVIQVKILFFHTKYIRYTFTSNHNVHKSWCGLYFWAPEPLIALIKFTKIYQLKNL